MTEPLAPVLPGPPAPFPPVGPWQWARVEQIRVENPHVGTLRLALPVWTVHLPGQHYVVRLTADDGYTGRTRWAPRRRTRASSS